MTPERRRVIEQRGAGQRSGTRDAYAQAVEQAAWGWEAQPDFHGAAVGRYLERNQE